jgi:hypothetical protein
MDATKLDASFQFTNTVGFTGRMRKNWIRKYPTVMPRFYRMVAGERQPACRNWIDGLLPDGYWRATNRMPETDGCEMTGYTKPKRGMCVFTGWLLESDNPHAETGSMRFYRMVAGERQPACRNWRSPQFSGAYSVPVGPSGENGCQRYVWTGAIQPI